MLKEEQVSDKLIDKLSYIGLSDHEIKIYLYLLKRGQALAREITKDTNTIRVTTYVTLYSLIEKGLIYRIEKGKKRTFYTVESPAKVLNLLETRLINTQNAFRELKDSMGELEVMYNENKCNQSKVIFYEKQGIKLLKKCRADSLEAKNGTMYEIGNFDNNPFSSKEELIAHGLKYKDRGIKVESFYTSKKGDVLKNYFTPSDWEVHYIPYDQFPFLSADIVTYDDKVVITSYRSKITTVCIEERSIAETFKELFKILKIGINLLNEGFK